MPAGAFYWLGAPRIEVEGLPVHLETRKITALLAVLSVDQYPHSRERLASLFWPDFGYDRAPANLRHALASVNSSLGAGWLKADREVVSLNGTVKVFVDFAEVQRCIREVQTHHRKKKDQLCPSCIEKLETAAHLYKGSFLEGFNLKDCPPFDLWQMEKRDELSQEIGWTLERLAEVYGKSGRFEEAINIARRWLSLDELHEPAHRTLMFFYAKSGKRSAAVRQYNECVRLLGKELDQEPDKSTQELYEQIRLRKLAVEEAEPQRDESPGIKLSPPRNEYSPGVRVDTLSTRLRPPHRRPTLVERSRLINLLDEGKQRPITLVSAPAGYGKTTLLAEWVHGCGLPVSWLSIEETDRESTHFLISLVAALRKLYPEIGVEASNMLQAVQTPPLSLVLDSLLNDLASCSSHWALVLDDFHIVSNSETESYFAGIVKHLPENLHLYIATRVDPGIPLARMRARAQLVEVRSNDLRFIPGEASEFLKKIMGLNIQDDDIAILERRTEGWAAGLQMAALSLQRRTNHSQFIREFGGSHRYIMDYLVVEVLENLPAEVQEFLLRTSILDKFRAELCDEVVEHKGSQAILEEMDQKNLFLTALDEERIWYRYHHLFAELLRHRLSLRYQKSYVAKLHLRAGSWFEKKNDIEEAMRHYLTGEEFGAALGVIKKQYIAILTQGGLRVLLAWTSKIPEEFSGQDAGACSAMGTIYGFAGKANEAERCFTQADKLFSMMKASAESGNVRFWKGEVSVMRAFLAEIAGRTNKAIELAKKADELLPAESLMTRSLIPFILSRAYRHEGDLEQAEICLNQQISLARAINNTWSLSGGIHEMVWLHRMRGHLREAEKLLNEFETLTLKPGTNGPAAKLMAARAEIEREHGNLQRAAEIVEESVNAVTRWGLPSDMCFCLQTRLRTRFSLGQYLDAAADLSRIDEIVRTSKVFTNNIPLYEAERVRIFIASGMIPRADNWLNNYHYPESGNPVNREVISITVARVLLSTGRHAEACRLLDKLLKETAAAGRGGRLLEILVLRAAAGEEEAPYKALYRALELAEPEGYVRIFLDEGEPVVNRLREVIDRPSIITPRLADYTQYLLSHAS